MKKVFALSLLAGSVLLATACQEKAPESAKSAVIEVKTEDQKQAYAIGSSISRYVAKTLKRQEEMGVKLDSAIILQGFEQGLAGKSTLTEEQEKEVLTSLDKQLTEKAKAKAEKDSAEAVEKGKKFLAENAKKEGVMVTESGLQYSVITAAEGKKPAAEDVVSVHYVGTLLDGTEFDSSVARGAPASFPLNRVIKGWTEGVQLMNVGSKFKFVIPSELAYGENANPKIPANSTLIFEVELLEIKDAPKAPTAPAAK